MTGHDRANSIGLRRRGSPASHETGFAGRSWHEPLDTSDENAGAAERLEVSDSPVHRRGRYDGMHRDVLPTIQDVDDRRSIQPGKYFSYTVESYSGNIGHDVALAASVQDAVERGHELAERSFFHRVLRVTATTRHQPRGRLEHRRDLAETIHPQRRSGGREVDDHIGYAKVRGDLRRPRNRNDLDFAASIMEELPRDTRKGRRHSGRRD